MTDIRFSVQHEDHSSAFISHFKYLMHMQILVDTTLASSDMNILKVHKIVLAATSSYFQDTLKQRSEELLFVLKINFDVLKSIVEFMYSGKTTFLEKHKLELLSAARFLKIRGLMELEFTDTLPEFTAPVIINQPVHIKQESFQQKLQIPVEKSLPESVLFCPTENSNIVIDFKDMVHIPIEIEKTEHDFKTVGKRRRSKNNKYDSDCYSDSNSTSLEINQSANEQLLLRTDQLCTKLFHQVRKTVQNIEECSIKAICKLKGQQGKHPLIDQLELSQAIINLEKQTDQRGEVMSSENSSVSRVELLEPLYGENGDRSTQMTDFNRNRENLTLNRFSNNLKTDRLLMVQDDLSNWLKYRYKTSADLELSDTINNVHNQETLTVRRAEFSNTEKMGNVELHNPFYDKNESPWMLSHCESVLKSAGLPTDVPFLFKSQDGSYVNLTGETLLDMVQSSNMEFEIIERKDFITENL